MHHIVTSIVAPLVPPYFSTLSHKRHDFREKKCTTRNMCVLFFSTIFVSNVSHSKMNFAKYCHNSEKSSRILPVILETCISSTDSRNSKMSNFNKTRPVVAKLFHDEVNSRF